MHLTIEEMCSLLNLPESTIQRWIRQGKIPVYRFGGEFVCLEKDLKKWAKSHHIVLSSRPPMSPREDPDRKYSLVAAMQRGGAFCHISGDDVSSLLKAVVAAAPLDPSIEREELFVKLIEREELSTTGIGRGIAIPHPRSPMGDAGAEPSITTYFLNKPVDYGAIDGMPVSVLFLMLSPSPDIHLRLLSKLSHLLRNPSFLAFLKSTPSSAELLSRVGETEKGMDPARGLLKSDHAP